MIEEHLINFGGIGILALVLLIYNYRLLRKADEREMKLAQVVANNTIALTQVGEVMRRCNKR